MMKEQTFILKRPIYNDIDFPIGTVVALVRDNDYHNFIVVKGILKGKKGLVADGMRGYLLENTTENMRLVKLYMSERKRLNNELQSLNKEWNKLPTVYFK